MNYLALFIALLAEISLLPRFMPIYPNILLATAIILSLNKPVGKACFIGFFAGFLLDIAVSRILFFNGLLFMYWTAITVTVDKHIYNRSTITVAAYAFIAAFANDLVVYFFSQFLWGRGQIAYTVLTMMIPTAICSGIYAFIVYYIMNKGVRRNKG